MRWRRVRRIAETGGALLILAWFVRVCMPTGMIFGDGPDWRADGVIVEVTAFDQLPRPGVTTVSRQRRSAPWGYQPSADGSGACRDPRFGFAATPPNKRIYHDGEEISIIVKYDAPGCDTLSVSFWGRHRPGSPWYDYWCEGDGRLRLFGAGATGELHDTPCDGTFSSNLHADDVALNEPLGEARVVAISSSMPPAGLDSPANIDGFELCTVILSVSAADGSGASQQVEVGCRENWDGR